MCQGFPKKWFWVSSVCFNVILCLILGEDPPPFSVLELLCRGVAARLVLCLIGACWDYLVMNVAQVRVKININMRFIQLKTSWVKKCIMNRLDEAFKGYSLCNCPRLTPGLPLLFFCSRSDTWGLGVFAQFDASLTASCLLIGAQFTT